MRRRRVVGAFRNDADGEQLALRVQPGRELGDQRGEAGANRRRKSGVRAERDGLVVEIDAVEVVRRDQRVERIHMRGQAARVGKDRRARRGRHRIGDTRYDFEATRVQRTYGGRETSRARSGLDRNGIGVARLKPERRRVGKQISIRDGRLAWPA